MKLPGGYSFFFKKSNHMVCSQLEREHMSPCSITEDFFKYCSSALKFSGIGNRGPSFEPWKSGTRYAKSLLVGRSVPKTYKIDQNRVQKSTCNFEQWGIVKVLPPITMGKFSHNFHGCSIPPLLLVGDKTP